MIRKNKIFCEVSDNEIWVYILNREPIVAGKFTDLSALQHGGILPDDLPPEYISEIRRLAISKFARYTSSYWATKITIALILSAIIVSFSFIFSDRSSASMTCPLNSNGNAEPTISEKNQRSIDRVTHAITKLQDSTMATQSLLSKPEMNPLSMGHRPYKGTQSKTPDEQSNYPFGYN